ncbi:hypothetical protein L484_002037 [Morus notabilis]|uniref:Uncharacterized protein n=1 Tax=Morus notabilis TaxID=981085 RepID=W9R7L3_9ROSA|nr:hypothetical protein L484_002037 [Morus notabilis]
MCPSLNRSQTAKPSLSRVENCEPSPKRRCARPLVPLRPQAIVKSPLPLWVFEIWGDFAQTSSPSLIASSGIA